MEVWKRSVSYSLLALYFGAFMEWLFYVTKPSFLSLLSFPEALLVLFIAPLPYAALILGVLSLLLLLQRVTARTARSGPPPRPPGLLGVAYALVPALFLASAFFMMIDRFSYTIFGLGVVTTRSGWRVLYGVLFLALLVSTARACFVRLHAAAPLSRSWISLATGVLAVSVLCLILALSSRSTIQRDDSSSILGPNRPPDIFLISGDGLEVETFESYRSPIEEMSAFGMLGPNTVIFDNSFPNANATAGSTALILTGKYATTTRKTHAYRFFDGDDAYQHLPGLLRAHGYRSIQIGSTHHVDSTSWGMRGAFDVRNRTSLTGSSRSFIESRLAGRINWELHFSHVLFDQMRQRLAHSFGGELMTQHHLAGSPGAPRAGDRGGVREVLDFIGKNPGPVFVQLHTMLARPPLTADLKRFEKQVRLIVDDLKARERFENSIIVIWSDHGQQYTTNRRLPLFVKFSTPARVTTTDWNVQTIDIAPTILDALGSPVPDWMEGRSLLKPIDRYTPIFSTTASSTTSGIEPDSVEIAVPGGLNAIGLIVCNRWYRIQLPSGAFEAGCIERHTSPCAPDDVPSDAHASEMMWTHLGERGYRGARAGR